MSGQLILGESSIVAVFEYDPELVSAVKRVPGARWDRAGKAWHIPVERQREAVAVAVEQRWWVDPAIAAMNAPDPSPEDMLEFDHTVVRLRFGYDQVKVRAVKQIPGVTWDQKSKGWVAPATSLAEAVDWAEKFLIPITEETYAERDRVLHEHGEMLRQSRDVDADIEVAGIPLLGYQRAGVAYAAAAKRTFIADDMGLGKSLMAIATLEHLNDTVPQYPALVICPPTLLLNWKNEYGKWLPHRSVSVIRNRKDWPTEQFDVLVVGYSNIKAWENQLQGFRSYVFDESHYMKSPDAQRTKAAVKIVKKVPDGGAVLCLTGTPVTNKPAEYAPQLELLGKLKDFGGKMGFYRRYCNAFRDRFGHWNIDGHSNLDELNERLRGNCYIRRTKDQVMTELPKVRHNRILVEGAPAAMKEYREAEANIIQYLMDRAAQIAVELGEKPGSAAVRAKMRAERNEHLVKIGTLRKLAARAKMAAVVEWVDTAIESGNKVVIAAHHREIVDELATRYGNLKIQGQMDVVAVERNKKTFQEQSIAEAPVIVLSIQAAKTGHTLTASQDVLFVELPWTWADVDQTYSRCHRLGQKGSVTATYLLCEGTIDEKIYDVVERKREVVKAAVEGGEMGSASGDVFDMFLSKI
jgi:SWI/SNF-related matrix-associated actin-dependent regulator 1 of chromatin subfamily A